MAVLFLFFLNSIAALCLFRELKLKTFPACVAVLFFAVHSVNAYTTFDASYSPELLYALFYIGSFVCFLRSRTILSLLCFVFSLMSKEAAVTLPFTLVLYEWIHSEHIRWRHLVPYFAVLTAYIAYVAFHLQVVSGHYTLDFGRSLIKNVIRAAAWAMNLPIGSYAQYRQVQFPQAAFLYGFAACIAGTAVFLLVRNKEKRAILFGAGWFLIACTPALPIYFYFRPYYLYLPLLGAAIVVGLAVQEIKESLGRWNSTLATLAVCALLAGNVLVIRQGARNEIRFDPAKGGTSNAAYQALLEIKRFRPTIPFGATIYIFNPDDMKSYWDYGNDALFKVFYNDPSLRVLYYSMGDRQPERDSAEYLVFLAYRDHHLVEQNRN